ncbi:MAG: hypothetical protein ACR2RA_10490, partial [Geminicoccaceae bacterium]
TLSWQAVELLPSSRMAEARRQAHNGVHWLARLANSYVEPEPNNRHVDLLWDADRAALRTKPFLENLAVELRVAELELQFCENGEPMPHVLSLEERTPAHVEAWVLVELLHRGVDRDHFSKDLPYQGRDVMLGDSEDHEVDGYQAELATLNAWLRNAAAVCTALRHELGRLTEVEPTAMPLICWPETFQLGLEFPLPQGFGAPSVRAGLSAGDSLRPEPFFFAGTVEQTLSADFDVDGFLSVQRIPAEKLAADDIIKFLEDAVLDLRKRLAA